MKPELQNKLISVEKAIDILKNGGVGVLPTDTVYGLAASAHNKEAVARLYALKHREKKPGTIVAASVQQLIELGVDPKQVEQAAKWWPNPLSVIVPTGDNLFYLHQTLDSLPFRIPADENFRKILEQTGPLATSSANQPGEPTSEHVQQAWDYFEDSVDFYVDGGDLSGRAPSTIIRFDAAGNIEVLRQGAVKIAQF
jgi:L-threonylcarbamoyladenylate synthase